MNKLRLVVGALLVMAAGMAMTACSEAPYEVGEASREVKGGQAICSIKCMAPPPGCEYRGALTTGPCNRTTCGHLVCDKKAPEPECCVSCAAPPEGCHYEGGSYCGPCSQVSCGSLVCDGSGF